MRMRDTSIQPCIQVSIYKYTTRNGPDCPCHIYSCISPWIAIRYSTRCPIKSPNTFIRTPVVCSPTAISTNLNTAFINTRTTHIVS